MTTVDLVRNNEDMIREALQFHILENKFDNVEDMDKDKLRDKLYDEVMDKLRDLYRNNPDQEIMEAINNATHLRLENTEEIKQADNQGQIDPQKALSSVAPVLGVTSPAAISSANEALATISQQFPYIGLVVLVVAAVLAGWYIDKFIQKGDLYY